MAPSTQRLRRYAVRFTSLCAALLAVGCGGGGADRQFRSNLVPVVASRTGGGYLHGSPAGYRQRLKRNGHFSRTSRKLRYTTDISMNPAHTLNTTTLVTTWRQLPSTFETYLVPAAHTFYANEFGPFGRQRLAVVQARERSPCIFRGLNGTGASINTISAATDRNRRPSCRGQMCIFLSHLPNGATIAYVVSNT